MTTLGPDDIVRLTATNNPAQAHIWQEALLEEGIRAQVVGDYLGAGLGSAYTGSTEIWVHKDDLARAEAILLRKDEG
jgi:hypothetical protein